MTRKIFPELNRRSVLQAGAATFAAASFGGLAGPSRAQDVEVIEITDDLIKAAQAEGALTVRYSSPVSEMKVLADGFRERFGIPVQVDRKVGALGNQQFATEERAGQHIMDVNYSADPPGLVNLAEEGFYKYITLKDLDSKLDPGSYVENIGYSPKWTEIVIGYDPAQIPHDEAKERFKTWEGLLAPDLKGRIGMNEPAGGGVPFATYLMFFRSPEYGPEFLDKIAAQDPRLYPGSAPGREDLAAGAIAVFIPNWESIAMIQYLAGSPSAWTYPEKAPAFTNTYFAISANAPHPAAARLWTAWFFTEEGASLFHKVQARPTLKGIEDNREAVAKLKQTDWWQPYPEEIRWVPEREDWEKSYNELIPVMRQKLGWNR